MPRSPLHFTRRESLLFTVVAFGAVLIVEACAAYHFYFNQRDVFACVIVVTSWAKEGLKLLLELLHLFEFE